MSSPVTLQAAPRRQRSLAGPVVLIVLGIVFLMGTMGVLHWSNLWRLYAQYWPVFIIMWGIIKLIEHQSAQRQGARASGIGAGGVLLLIFLIVSGFTASESRKVNWQSLHDQIGIEDEDFSNWFGQTFNYTDSITENFSAGSTLHVISDRGSITVVPSNEKRVKVEISKKIHSDSQQDADKLNLQTKPQVISSEKTITVNANTQGAGEHGVTSDLTISIPGDAALTISAKHGDISVSNRRAPVEISAQHGDVTLADIRGEARLNLQRCSVKASNISGDLLIDGRVNEVSATDIQGEARLTGEFYESVKMAHIGKTATFKSGRSDMEFAKLDGSLDLDSGELRAESVGGPARVSTRDKDVRLEGIAGDLRVDDSNGSVEVLMRKIGNIQIDNKNGDIQLTVPGQAGFRVDVRALNGEIQSDFPELKVENGENQATATGTVGNGNALLKLNNEHGTVEIHKGSTQASLPAEPARTRRLPQPASPPEPTEN